MPKRLSVKRVETPSIQGEDSYVVVSAVKVKEIQRTRRLSLEDDTFDGFVAGLDMIRAHVLGWNWVDDDGTPLPVPKDDPSVIDELSTEEVTYLANLLTGEEESKN